ncbi:putative transmembrane protein [Mycolicibacterium fortuitum]|uniref:Putative transmembrane protein n=1 Tax=Mycolicibacterium fortuitum TaxID=1766 RepID=A0A378UXU0_MYCFO|nr:putative transmembrane protein [Mycolicibacterium fortuitum]
MKRRAVLELAVAVVAAVGCVLSWIAAATPIEVAPVLEGEPATTAISYSSPLLVLALALAGLAGVLAVLGIARLRR